MSTKKKYQETEQLILYIVALRSLRISVMSKEYATNTLKIR